MSQIQHIPDSLSQPGSHGKQSPGQPPMAAGVSLGYFCDISVIPWGFSALGAWGGAAGPPPIQSCCSLPRERAQGSAPAHEPPLLCRHSTTGHFPNFFKGKRGEEGAVEGIQALPAPAPGCSEAGGRGVPSKCSKQM